MIQKFQLIPFLGVVLAALTGVSMFPSEGRAETRSFRMFTVEANGVKFWLPSTIVVKKGDTVKIEATSKIPGANSVHGFEISDFKVKEIVNEKGKTVEFKADKSGVFAIGCQLHPAHVGAQLVVID